MTSSDWTHSHLKFRLLNFSHQSSMSSLTIAFPQDNPTQLFISEASASVTIPFFNSGTFWNCISASNLYPIAQPQFQSFIGATTWSFTSRPLVLARIDAGVSLEWLCNFTESAGCFNGACQKMNGPNTLCVRYGTYKPLHRKNLQVWCSDTSTQLTVHAECGAVAPHIEARCLRQSHLARPHHIIHQDTALSAFPWHLIKA